MESITETQKTFHRIVKCSIPLSLFLLGLISGCNKSSGPAPANSDSVQVFLAGHDAIANSPAYWVNETSTPLPFPSYSGRVSSMDIAGMGNDVYVGGWHVSNDSYMSNRPCYWKNGVRRDLPMLDDRPQGGGLVYSLAVAEGDVFLVGACVDSVDIPGQPDERLNYPTYWKNEQIVQLNTLDGLGGGAVWGISLMATGSGQIPYVVGSSYAPSGYQEPCYWRLGGGATAEDNLKARALSTMGYGGAGLDVEYVGGHLSVCGWINNAEGFNIPCRWFNGERTDLDIDEGMGGVANSLKSIGGDTYIVGAYSPRGQPLISIPCYWKNGKRVDLPLPTVHPEITQATSIDSYEGDVYISGITDRYVFYWKNGVLVEYPHLLGNAIAIGVRK